MEVQTFKLVTNYITEDKELCIDMKSIIDASNQTLIVAPQGVGKTTFIKEVLGDECYVISPTRALANQINSHDKYQDLATTLMCGYDTIKENTEDYSYVVFDECHYLVNYCSFAYNQVEHFYKIYDLCKELDIKIIFMTATPQTLYCLEDIFYSEIDYKIEIQAHRQYVDKVYVYNELNQELLVHELLNYHRQDYMQVALINDTAKIVSISDKLKKEGLKVAAISSKNRNSDDNLSIFRNLTNNRYIDLDVLLVTSWADVGINFINKNISHIYYECGNSYERGSLTSLMQWIARPRHCKPDLHIVQPKLSKYDEEILESVVKDLNITESQIVTSLVDNGLQSEFIPLLTNKKMDRYQELADKMNQYQIDRAIGIENNHFIQIRNLFFVNKVMIQYEIHRMIDILVLQNIYNLNQYFEFSKIIKVKFYEIGSMLVTEENYRKIKHLLDIMAKTGQEIKSQKVIKDLISSYIGQKCNCQISRLVNSVSDEMDITLKARKSHGRRIYGIEYVEEYNPYDYYSGEIPSYLETEIECDYDIHDGVNVPYISGYHLKDGYSLEDIIQS